MAGKETEQEATVAEGDDEEVGSKVKGRARASTQIIRQGKGLFFMWRYKHFHLNTVKQEILFSEQFPNYGGLKFPCVDAITRVL